MKENPSMRTLHSGKTKANVLEVYECPKLISVDIVNTTQGPKPAKNPLKYEYVRLRTTSPMIPFYRELWDIFPPGMLQEKSDILKENFEISPL